MKPEATVGKSPVERLMQKIAASRFMTISALLHLVIILLFGGTVLFNKYVEPPDFSAEGSEFLAAGPTDSPPAPEPAPSMPTPEMTAPPPTVTPPQATLTMITSAAPTTTGISIPITMTAPTISKSISDVVPVPTTPRNTGAVALPAGVAQRSGSKRGAAMMASGGKPSAEQAVMKALRWLQTAQNPDGTWGEKSKGAMTGLALLAFLGHGETPESSPEFARVVNAGIEALLAQGTKEDGRFSWVAGGFGSPFTPAPVYQHGIATYALGEAYAMTKNEKLVPVLTKAIDHILKGQRGDGGWYYAYNTREGAADTSVTGWQIQALKAFQLSGIENPGIKPAMENGVKSIENVYNPSNGAFGYRKVGDRNYSLTGVGVLCKLFAHHKSTDKMVRDAIKNIESREVKYDSEEADLYAWYYNTQACFQAQGGTWDRWNRRFQDEIVKSQSPDGSWPPLPHMNPREDHGGLQKSPSKEGAVYRTTLCTLMLEVFYRYLPTSKETAAPALGPSGL